MCTYRHTYHIYTCRRQSATSSPAQTPRSHNNFETSSEKYSIYTSNRSALYQPSHIAGRINLHSTYSTQSTSELYQSRGNETQKPNDLLSSSASDFLMPRSPRSRTHTSEPSTPRNNNNNYNNNNNNNHSNQPPPTPSRRNQAASASVTTTPLLSPRNRVVVSESEMGAPLSPRNHKTNTDTNRYAAPTQTRTQSTLAPLSPRNNNDTTQQQSLSSNSSATPSGMVPLSPRNTNSYANNNNNAHSQSASLSSLMMPLSPRNVNSNNTNNNNGYSTPSGMVPLSPRNHQAILTAQSEKSQRSVSAYSESDRRSTRDCDQVRDPEYEEPALSPRGPGPLLSTRNQVCVYICVYVYICIYIYIYTRYI